MSLIGLGRFRAPDPRDKNYAVPRRTKEARDITSRYWVSRGLPLDQGATSQCVIYAGDKYLTTFPISNASFGDADARTFVYKEVQKLDEWPGEEYDGTSVRALFKYLKSCGLVSEYRWAFDAATVVEQLLTTGPVVMGTDWYMDMFATDWHGYIQPTGEAAGGHAYLLLGANKKRKNPDGTTGAVRMLNSWGQGWAEDGKAWITFDHLEQLIAQGGEACCSHENHVDWMSHQTSGSNKKPSA